MKLTLIFSAMAGIAAAILAYAAFGDPLLSIQAVTLAPAAGLLSWLIVPVISLGAYALARDWRDLHAQLRRLLADAVHLVRDIGMKAKAIELPTVRRADGFGPLLA